MLFRRRKRFWSEQGEVAVEALPAEAEAQEPARRKLGWFEKRARRRRRRIVFEEVLGWILVPALIYLAYLGLKAVGGIPKELVDFGNELIGIAMRGGH